jgi:hypothetical protein
MFNIGPNATRNGGNRAKTQKIRPQQSSKTDGLKKTVAWTLRTLKTDKRRKRYGKNKVQGLFCEETGFLRA